MELSGQLYVPFALSGGKKYLVPIGEQTELAQRLGRNFGKQKNLDINICGRIVLFYSFILL
jgi:hypothetical protein